MQRVLLISAEKQLKNAIKTALPQQYFSIDIASTKITAQRCLKKTTPDVIIFDVPKDDSLTANLIIQEIKKLTPVVQTIILQDAQSKNSTIVDDASVITKTKNTEEVLAKVKERIIKNSQRKNVLQVADLQLDRKRLLVHRGGNLIDLTPQEFQLLHFLMKNQGKSIPRKTILKVIWQYSEDIETRVVDVYIGYLRKKIDSDYSKKLIHSLRGVGYMIKE